MLARGLLEHGRLWECFDEIEPLLYRFPAVAPIAFRRSVEDVAGRGRKDFVSTAGPPESRR
jgi:hypothetical protein